MPKAYVLGLVACAAALTLHAQQSAPPKWYGKTVDEIVVTHEDGSFTLRGVQLMDQDTSRFRAEVYNGMKHDWELPVFSVVYEGHEVWDASKSIRREFTVRGQCDWLREKTCTLIQELKFPFFTIEKYEFRLIGGKMKPNDEEIKAEKGRQQKADLDALEYQRKYREEVAKRKEERSKKEEAQARVAAKAEAAAAKAEAAAASAADTERRRVRAACAAVYQNTADKRMGDLTVKEDQQVKACQALGLYPPR